MDVPSTSEDQRQSRVLSALHFPGMGWSETGTSPFSIQETKPPTPHLIYQISLLSLEGAEGRYEVQSSLSNHKLSTFLRLSRSHSDLAQEAVSREDQDRRPKTHLFSAIRRGLRYLNRGGGFMENSARHCEYGAMPSRWVPAIQTTPTRRGSQRRGLPRK